MARRNNPDLRKAELSVKRAEEVRMQAMTKYFPQVRGMAFGYHALNPLVDIGVDDIGNATVRDLLNVLYGNFGAALGMPNTFSLLQHGYGASVVAIQPVFVGGKIVAGNQLAKLGVEAAKLQAQMSERDKLEEVEESYWLVYGLQQKRKIIDDANALLDTTYQMVHSAVEAGLALPYDLSQVEIKRDEVARQQLQLQSGIRLAKRALALSIGLESSDSLDLAEQEKSEELITELLPNDSAAATPEQQLLSLQVRAAELEKRMVLADALPQIALGANYGYSHFQTNFLRDGIHNKNGNGALFVTLNVPITGWWETTHKMREKQYAIEQAKIDEENLGTQLQLRTQQAYDQMNDALAMVQLRRRACEHAREAHSHMQANYEAGRATIAEWLQAQMALTQAESDLTDAEIAYRVHVRRYKDLTHSER
jgi:outer membrane protein TolC